MLTLQKLKEMEPDTIFATGTANDDPEGLFMANTNKQLRWCAVRGGIEDWCIYCHLADRDVEYIRRQGDKVTFESHIRKLVPCDNEAFKMYRY
jgi:tRNA 2-selenouridine synthase SelU